MSKGTHEKPLSHSQDFEGVEEGIASEGILDLADSLTDAGKYCYAGLCAVTLHKLYNNDWDKPFCDKCINCIVKNLQLPPQVMPIMGLLITGEMENSLESFLDVLKSETVLEDNLSILLQDLIAIAVQEGEYDARWRVLIRHLAELFGAPFEEMELYEITVVHCLTNDEHVPTEEEKKKSRNRNRLVKAKRYALIGLATLGGGALIGVTGGLAAPAISTGLVSLMGGSAILASLGYGAGAAMVGTLFGAAGAGLAGYKMNKRVGEIEEFGFGQLQIQSIGKDNIASVTTPQLDITIALSGWIKDENEEDFTRPWKCLFASREQYYLRYESEYLLELGKAIEYIASIAISMATQEALKYTILSGIVSAIAWPAGLLGFASVIDNPWGVCCRRSAQVGKHLADVLINREHGRRPVTLIGYSLGARVIYYCLREMSERENCHGLILDAYLIGAPCTGRKKRWDQISKVVAGKIVNAYCKTDWLLRFLYRTLSMHTVAGLQPIESSNPNLINIDLSHLVSGHGEYPDKMNLVLKELGIRIIESEPQVTLPTVQSDSTLTVPPDKPNINKSHSDSVLSQKEN